MNATQRADQGPRANPASNYRGARDH